MSLWSKLNCCEEFDAFFVNKSMINNSSIIYDIVFRKLYDDNYLQVTL